MALQEMAMAEAEFPHSLFIFFSFLNIQKNLGGHNRKNVMLAWGYGWRDTYAGSVFIGGIANWAAYPGAHMLMIRWRDYNGDGLVQINEL